MYIKCSQLLKDNDFLQSDNLFITAVMVVYIVVISMHSLWVPHNSMCERWSKIAERWHGWGQPLPSRTQFKNYACVIQMLLPLQEIWLFAPGLTWSLAQLVVQWMHLLTLLLEWQYLVKANPGMTGSLVKSRAKRRWEGRGYPSQDQNPIPKRCSQRAGGQMVNQLQVTPRQHKPIYLVSIGCIPWMMGIIHLLGFIVCMGPTNYVLCC